MPPDPIAQQVDRLRMDFQLQPVTAGEIEFYLHGSEGRDLSAFWKDVSDACVAAGIEIAKIEKERGREQHEMAILPAAPIKTAHDLQSLKGIIIEQASRHGLRADFSAKPWADQPGSGLHIHIHLADLQGNNVFYKDDTRISDSLKFSLGGLLAAMMKDMMIFAPHEESYARFTPGSNAPLTVSWGANNRTTALRLPDSDHDNKRIEHRVAGADSDPTAVMMAILAAMHDGLTRHLDPGPQIYGDAGLPMYKLPKLPASLEEAKKIAVNSLSASSG